jgi:predicted transcriptional regulator
MLQPEQKEFDKFISYFDGSFAEAGKDTFLPPVTATDPLLQKPGVTAFRSAPDPLIMCLVCGNLFMSVKSYKNHYGQERKKLNTSHSAAVVPQGEEVFDYIVSGCVT